MSRSTSVGPTEGREEVGRRGEGRGVPDCLGQVPPFLFACFCWFFRWLMASGAEKYVLSLQSQGGVA